MRFVVSILFVASLLMAENVLVNGKKVFYVNKGTGQNAVVLIHGWSCDHTFLGAQMDELAKGHRVISLDLPGHGQSESPTSMKMEGFVSAVEAVRAHARVNQVMLIGHSMGALVAREYARKYPSKAKGLVFLDGSIFQLPPGEADRLRWAEGIGRLAKSFGPSNEKQVREINVSVFLSNMYTDATPRDLQMMILRKVLTTSPETAEAAMLSMADLKLWVEDRHDIPVLALRAGRQRPANEEPYLKSLYPKLHYKFMPGMSHFLMMEQPAKINDEIVTFLKASIFE